MSKSNLAVTEKLYTPEEYLAFEREAEEKHEFVDGEIVAMAGASREHNLIGTNVTVALGFRLRGRNCELYANDMRVRMRKNRYGYPDVVVVCGAPEFDDEEFDVLLNPTIAVEVLSKSTRFRDKTEKLVAYQKMESLRECLLIEQIEPRIEHYIKQTSTQWLLKIYENLDETISLESIDCQLPVAEIYAQIEFKDEPEK
jgi:Uma2 family endonuclease